MVPDPDRRLAHIAGAQHGLFQRSQAYELGVTRRWVHARVRRGSIDQLSPDGFRIAGAPNTWRQRLLAAAWAGGPDCCVSHRAAAALHAYDGFTSELVEVVHHQRRDYRSTPGVIVHVTSVLDPCDRMLIGAIPVTTPARTLIDLGAVVTIDRLEEALDSAERDRRVDRSDLIERHAQIRQSGRNGIGPLAELLDARKSTDETPGSVLERRMLRLLAAADLPLPTCQLHVERDDGRSAFLDLAYPEIRLGIELDGQGGHSTRLQRQRDGRRQNNVVLSDWRILRFTYEEVKHDGDYVTGIVRRALVKGAARHRTAA